MSIKLGAQERRREHVSLDVVAGSAEQDASIEIRGSGSGSLADSVRRSIHISPAGYPTRESIAGRLSDRARVRLPIPKDIVPGSLSVTVRAYPSPLADVMSGVESTLARTARLFRANIGHELSQRDGIALSEGKPDGESGCIATCTRDVGSRLSEADSALNARTLVTNGLGPIRDTRHCRRSV